MLTILDLATGQFRCEPATQPTASPEAAGVVPPAVPRLALQLQSLATCPPVARQAPPIWDDAAYTAAQPDRTHQRIVRQ